MIVGWDIGSGEFAVWRVFGFTVTLDVKQGHLTVQHDGTITWSSCRRSRTTRGEMAPARSKSIPPIATR